MAASPRVQLRPGDGTPIPGPSLWPASILPTAATTSALWHTRRGLELDAFFFMQENCSLSSQRRKVTLGRTFLDSGRSSLPFC